ncbi:MAG TPA: transposase [Anaerolineales bacterium]|nr:transposase [Anaerolineales bacterium]
MEFIIKWLQTHLVKALPEWDLSLLASKERGKLRLSPEQLLQVIHAQALAEWALAMAHRFSRPQLKKRAGAPQKYRDSSILLMAIVQSVWRKSYEQIVDSVATHPDLAEQIGFTGRTISKGQYWERRQALGILPFLFFFLGLVGQLVRLGVITGRELIVDSTLLKAWYRDDPDATWQKYAGRKPLFGYKVYTVLCHQADLPVFVFVTAAHVHDSQVGWLIVLLAAVLYGLRVLVVYADAAYFDGKMFWVIHDFLGGHAAVDYDLRRSGKRKLATLFFLQQWQRLVMAPCTAIERHFAWMKRYVGLNDFQGYTLLRVTQFVLLTYSAALAVALAAHRYQRPDLYHRHSMVLAQV